MDSKLEQILMTSYKDEMISFMETHTEYFEEAIELAVSDEEKLSWRSAWLLRSCMEKNDLRIRKYINKIIKGLPGKEDGHQRELIKILLQMRLNEEQEGNLFDVCMNLWEGIHKSPSVRFTAFKFIYGITEKYPELKSEVEYLTQDHFLETLSPGIRHSAKRIITGRD